MMKRNWLVPIAVCVLTAAVCLLVFVIEGKGCKDNWIGVFIMTAGALLIMDRGTTVGKMAGVLLYVAGMLLPETSWPTPILPGAFLVVHGSGIFFHFHFFRVNDSLTSSSSRRSRPRD